METMYCVGTTLLGRDATRITLSQLIVLTDAIGNFLNECNALSKFKHYATDLDVNCTATAIPLKCNLKKLVKS